MKNLQKDFLPFELSLKMKQLGFDEPCMYYVDEQNNSFIYNFQTHPDEFIEWCGVKVISTPTYSQSFKFFREKYNLQSEIEFRHCEYSFKINFQKLADGENPPVMVWHLIDSWLGLNMNLFKTYEEAELECLKKLIEIVKTK
jgi:hypothetical protein